ncbi:TraY domain-containing protein [Escherichia coli]|uniref:TraY domain-containing protein n=1 Tax=Escherichia coli TaxID=562 RepID=UPI002A367157|nr:TraY domain-containing protein [Escherichia coli]
MMSLWDALRMNMMISYQELVRTFLNRAGNIYGKSLVKYLTMRLDDETNQLLIAAKNRSGWCKTDEAADRVIDHLIKFPDFYNSEIFREADKEEDITFNTL